MKLDLATSLAELMPLCENVEDPIRDGYSADASAVAYQPIQNPHPDNAAVNPTPRQVTRDSTWRKDYNVGELASYLLDNESDDLPATKMAKEIGQGIYKGIRDTKSQEAQKEMQNRHKSKNAADGIQKGINRTLRNMGK